MKRLLTILILALSLGTLNLIAQEPTPASPPPGMLWLSGLNGSTAYACWMGSSTATDTNKIAAALAWLPSTGGTVDLGCYHKALTLTSDIFSTVSKPITLLLPPTAVSVNADATIPANFSLVYQNGSSLAAIGGHTLTDNSVTQLPAAETLSKNGNNVWDGLKLVKSTTVGPTVGNEGVTLRIENNRTAVIDDQAVITAFEAVARARGKGRELTIRGANIRTYIDETYANATAITSVGVDASVRASGAVVPDPGTAFVGVRAYMAPGFTAMTNVTNNHAFWAYNEHATNAITNVLYASDGGGGFDYGLNLSSTKINIADINFSNGQRLVAVPAGKSLQLYDSAQTTASGTKKLDIKVESLTNALNGDQIAVYGRSNNKVNAMTGSIEGAYFQAANYNASAGGTARGAYIETLTKGVNIGTARGLEVNVDTDDNETFGNEISALFAQVQTGSSETFSGVATVARLTNSGVAGGGGKALNSFLRLDSESNQVGATVLIDASAAKFVAGGTNQVCVFSFQNSDGNVRYLVVNNTGTVAVVTSWP